MKYKISVVVPTFNGGEDIIKLFESLQAQSLDGIEVIFVDDASDDEKSLAILDDLNQFDNVRVVYLEDNSGFPGRGRNVGLNLARGDYVIFSDQDDTYNPDAFEKMYKEITKNNADLVFTNYFKVKNNEKTPVETIFNHENINITDFKQDLRVFSLGPAIWTKLFRKNFLRDNNITFLENMLAEDLELYIHSLILSKKTIYLDDFYSYNYSIRDSSKDKSTIHLRTKLIFSKMVEGYFKTYDLLLNLDKTEYFDLVFKDHFVYFITSLIKSKLNNSDKKDLLIAINPLIKKELAISPNLGERRYNKLTRYLANDDFDSAVREIKSIKRKNSFKKIFGH